MKISTMRKLDYYLGVPLTFFFSMLTRIKRLFWPRVCGVPSPVRSVLLVELSEMGSMIQLMPLIAKLRTNYPEAKIHFVTFRSSSSILKLLRNVDDVWTLNTNSLASFTADSLKLVFKLLFTRFDIVFDCELFSRTSSLIAFCSGAKVNVGFDHFSGEGLYRGNFITHAVNYNPHLNICKNFLSMYYALHEPAGDVPHCKCVIPDEDTALPPFQLPEGVIENFRKRLQESFPQLKAASALVVLNPNSSEALPLRRWPMANYVEITRKLLSHEGVAIAITGGPSEREDAAFIRAQLPQLPIIDLSGFTSMEELVALYFIADLMITNDSGPAQFAALAKMKTITFFGPETPDLYGALNPNAYNFFKRLHCSPCYTAQNNRTSVCTNNVCMQQIGVEEVYAKAKEMLGIA